MGGRGAGSASGKRTSVSKQGAEGALAAAAAANPNYANGLEWQINCQRCVYAYEMNRRGGGVYEAKPNISGANGQYDFYAYGGWNSVMDGQTVQSVGSPSRKKVVSNIDAKTSQWGDGSRGIIRVIWAHGHAGHVFNFERINGVTRYFDAQVGKEIDINDYLSSAKPTKTSISRIDNLEFNSAKLNDCVRKVK